MKRKIESLERDNTILHDLVNQIRGADDLEVRQIVSLVRSNASLPEVHNSLLQLRENAQLAHQQVNPVIEQWHHTTKTALIQNSASQTQSHSSNSPVPTEPASRVLSVNRLIDNPIHQISAARWTTVTQDDHLVSHLVSLWATWCHSLPDGIVMEPLLREMKAGRLNSPFCSPFLVSCILAAACPLSDYDEAKTVKGTASELMQSFVKEAKGRLMQSQSAPSITNVQGLGLLYVVTSEIGQDRDGYHYAIQAATMGEELARERETILKTAKTVEARDELAFVLDTTCWGIFSLTTASMSAWLRPQLVMQPKIPYPTASANERGLHATKWSPYPRDGTFHDIYLSEVLRCHASLAILTAELTDELYGDREDRSQHMARRAALKDLDVRLFFWHAKLPDYMKQTSTKSPHVLLLLIWYQGIVMKLRREGIRFRLQNHRVSHEHDTGNDADDGDDNDDDDDEEKISSIELGQRSYTGIKSHPDTVQRALDVVDLCRSYRVNWEYSRLHCFMSQPCYLALYILIEQNDKQQYDSEITEVCTAFRAISRRFPFAFSLLHMAQIDLQQRGFSLPTPAEKLFEEFDQPDIAQRLEKGAHNSLYPSPHLAVWLDANEEGDAKTTTHPTNMSDFLKTFDKLRIRE